MQETLQDLFEKRIHQFISNTREKKNLYPKAERKLASLSKRSAEIVKVKAAGNIIEKIENGNYETVHYMAHFQYLIKQKDALYLEEETEMRLAKLFKGEVISDEEIAPVQTGDYHQELSIPTEELEERSSFQYDRLKAVQYAERWWNSYNPAYKKFENNCTNYISQCLRAGGSPMRGYPSRGSGWWMQNNNWSYSWAIANSLRLYLANSKSGLRAKEVSSPDQLVLGDVICYDFEGDGRFNHNTMVTGKDAYGMPLVNANTYNSRMRYWAYEDSSAYTPNIKYKFFSILD
ncbi:amidase domain-containing protein [Neobacillus cucumis]|uniref:amidase domain-containing protein n=1 Tax=Neobacillus cucumis TaxID=1740721 RepID=UPI0018DFD522|nr:amidase domain-containing protein [Neobacillus cucumis]MBI0580252.1 amidase domain-containing protein [Neobacillus cucumis]